MTGLSNVFLLVGIVCAIQALRVSPNTLERLGCWLIACAVANRKRKEIRRSTYRELLTDRGLPKDETVHEVIQRLEDK